jgi:hypothetical protein
MEPIDKIYDSFDSHSQEEREAETKEEVKFEENINRSFDTETFVENNSKDCYNLNAIGLLIQVINLLIESIMNNMKMILNNQAKDVEDTIIDIMYVSAMFRVSPELFNQVLDTDLEDFLYFPRTAPQWVDLHKVYKYVDFDKDSNFKICLCLETKGKKTVRESLRDFMDWLFLTKATISMHGHDDSGISKLWSTMVYGTYYMLSKKSRIQKCKISVTSFVWLFS